VILKSLLLRWANAYTQQHKTPPPKEAREELRSFYERYHALRHHIQREELNSLPAAKQLQLLKSEKKRLQIRLNQFKRVMENSNDQSVGAAHDFAPVQKLYDEYQQLKVRIAMLEATAIST
jgi:predicted RNase H-like nuclease (RuvC/YqgF family)